MLLRSNNLRHLRHALTVLIALGMGVAVDAQSEDDGEIVWLSPFVVKAKSTNGYARRDAGTATRISMELIETPLSVEVISEDFIRDTGRSNLVEIFDYSASVDTSPDDVLRNDATRIRGFKAGFVLKDGFKKYYDAPLEAVERVEVVKGPNAVFFGQAQPGGVINYFTKRPLFEPRQEVSLEAGAYEHYKASLDSSGPLYKDIVAYRFIASFRDSESWMQNEAWESQFYNVGVTIKPTDRIDIWLNYEYSDAHQDGGINNSMIGQVEYLRDYYANDGLDWGYQVDWSELDWVNTVDTSRVDPSPRYPWPDEFTSSVIEMPETGLGGINPRWDGTLTPALIAFYGGMAQVPAELLNWTSPDQGQFPEEQRNIKLPFQYRMIQRDPLFDSGGDYQVGWRMMKWFQSGMTEFPTQWSGPIFPLGYDFNINLEGSYHDTQHHIGTWEISYGPTDWLAFRYAGNYLDNKFLRVQQHRSNTMMDGFTHAPILGYGKQTKRLPISGASANSFDNERLTHQFDTTFNFDTQGSRHTFVFTFEHRDDRFIEYSILPSDAFYDTALFETRRIGSGDNVLAFYEYLPGASSWDVYAEEPLFIGDWADVDGKTIGGSTDRKVEIGYGVAYRGQYFNDRLNVLTGVRRESQENFVFEDSNGDGSPTVGDSKGKIYGTTPMIGATWSLSPGWSIYASYSESFLPPSRPNPDEVIFYEGPVDAAQPVPVPVEPLSNESGVGYEAGIKFDALGSRLTGQVTVFHLERADIVVVDSELIDALRRNYFEYGKPWLSGLDGGGERSPKRNSGLEVSEGLELDAIYSPTPNWTITASLSYLWEASLKEVEFVTYYGDVEEPIGSQNGLMPHSSLFTNEVLGTYTLPSTGEVIEVLVPLSPAEINNALAAVAGTGEAPINPYTGEEMVIEPRQWDDLAGVSKLRFAVWNRYEFREGMFEGLTIGAGANYQSKQRPLQDKRLDYWNPGFWIADAMVNYAWDYKRTRMSLQLNVNNVFDKRAIDSGFFGINDPRTWKLTARIQF